MLKFPAQVMKLIGRQPTTHIIDVQQNTVCVPYNKLTFVERWVPGVAHFIAGVIVALTAVGIAAFF
jgi:glutamate-1-semialdehyde aminotransferase